VTTDNDRCPKQTLQQVRDNEPQRSSVSKKAWLSPLLKVRSRSASFQQGVGSQQTKIELTSGVALLRMVFCF
jgi:hypothetical protein